MKIKFTTPKMSFLWRRRSSVVKIVLLLTAVWFTIAFLIYSEDRHTRTDHISNNIPPPQHLVDGAHREEFDEFIQESHNNLHPPAHVIKNSNLAMKSSSSQRKTSSSNYKFNAQQQNNDDGKLE